MGLFLHAVAPAPSPPLTPTSAAEQLVGLFQVGRSLERYMEEFVELAYLTDWSEAHLIALFLDGLDEDTIRFYEPDDYVSLTDTINLILYLNGSKFFVQEVQDFKCSSRPVFPETRTAWSVCQALSSSSYPSGELSSCVRLGSHTSAGSRRRRRRNRKTVEPSPVFTEPSPNSAEPTPVPVGFLVEYEGMDWTPLQVSPVSAEPTALACQEPTPAHKPTPFPDPPWQPTAPDPGP
ncbi:hypothetical protein DPX16_13368 [Anabarilius grahami]|uniref:Uncharacterized protein n=1 Tax=Anabarilius grahami TaxID=495550 RepID=A0A3N0YN74_ANAGA|nr:hypothetical protein DPX16_13368 [Anabarilius grahami]